MTKQSRFITIPDALDVDRETLTDNFGRFRLGPLARGWGWTMGTILRRAMLSSVQGAAPTQIRLDGVIHEFSTIDGVLEDVPLIVLNVKKLRFKIQAEEEPPEGHFARLHAGEPRAYTGTDLELPAGIEVANPEAHILTVTAQDRSVNMEIKIEQGRGYENQESVKKRSGTEPSGTVFLDAFYSPVRRVKIEVTNVRYRERTDYEQVVAEVATDGTVSPEEAMKQTAELLQGHVSAIARISEEDTEGGYKPEEESPFSDVTVESLEVPNTVKRALADHGLETVADVVSHTEEEIIGWGDIKPRSFATLRSRLEQMGAKFAESEPEPETEEKEEKDET